MLFGFIILFIFILATPVYAHIEVVAEKEMKGTLKLVLWGIKKEILIKNQNSKALMGVLSKARIFVRANHIKRMLRLSVHVLEIRGDVRISFSDAAKTVLITCAAREVAAFLNQRLKCKHTLRVRTDFSFGSSAMYFSGILFARLGNLLVIGIMALSLAKEAKKWNTRSET